jgi:predicted regulator of Ras-like GTPase activity (Roadblock/LC7/MglB family)
MPAVRRTGPSLEDQVRAQLQLIRTQVPGVRGSLAATSDGLVFAHDVPGLEPTQIAAISAATLALASRATLATGCGSFRETVARGSEGYLAVYAAGASAIVAVMGTSSLNVAMLHYRARAVIDRIAAFTTQSGASATPTRTASRATAASVGQTRGADGPGSLPRRRPPTP